MFQYLAATVGLRLCSLAATIVLVMLMAPSALPLRTAAQTPNCLKDVAGQNMNCTAGDVEIAEFHNSEPISCNAGESVTLNLRARLKATADERYDIGLFVAVDGGDATTGLCHRDYLPWPLAAGGTCASSEEDCLKDADCPGSEGDTCTGGYNPGLPFPGDAGGPFYDAEPGDDGDPSDESKDVCGDLEQGVETYYDLAPITVPCVDSDGNGLLDIGTCTSWDHQKGNLCRSPEDTVPNNPAKCDCSTPEVGNVVVEPGAIEVTKSAVPDAVDEPGDDVTFRFTVTNPSGVTVTLESLVDSVFTDLTTYEGSTCEVPQSLGPADSYICSLTAWISGLPGSHYNEFTASGRDPYENEVSGSDVVEIVIADLPPAIALTKTVSPTSVMEPGGSVRYKAEVTNNSNPGDPLTLTGLVDTLYGNLLDGGNDAITENNCMPNSVIQPSETYSCTFEAEVSGSAGQEVSDTITATAVDDEDNVAQANDDAAVIITAAPEPAISVVKTADPASVVEPGGPVLYTVQVTNDTNDVPVILTSLTDDPHGDLIGKDTANISASTCEQADIQPGISYQCTFEAEVSGSEGQVVSDTVTALARASSGKEATGYASAAVTITAKGLPHILVTKTAHPLYVYAPRGTVTYRVKVTNDSDDVPVTLTSLDDDPYGDLTDDLNNPEISNSTCDLSAPEAIAIEPGNSYECAFRAEVEGVAGETVTDTVTAVALDPSGNQAEGTAIATVTIVTVPPDTGVALPAPVISGSLAVLGTALLTAGAFLRRQRLRAD